MNKFRKLSIRKTLVLSFGIVITLFLITSVTTSLRIFVFSDSIKTSYYEDIHPQEAIIKLNSDFYSLRRYVNACVGVASPDNVNNVNDVVNSVEEQITIVNNDFDNLIEIYEEVGDFDSAERFRKLKTKFNDEYVPFVRKIESAAMEQDIYLASSLDNDLTQIGTEISNELDEELNNNLESVKQMSYEQVISSNRLAKLSIVVALIISILCIIIARLLGKNLSLKIQLINDGLSELASGNVNVNIANNDENELGQLSRNTTKVADVMRSMTNEINKLSDEYEKGNISYELDPTMFEGGFSTMIKSVSSALDGLKNDTNLIMNTIGEFSAGNFNVELQRLPGEKSRVNDVVETMRSNLLDINKEIVTLIDKAYEGDLNYRADAKNYHGGWKTLLEGLNNLMMSITSPIDETIDVLNEISKGNLTKKMDKDYQGKFKEIKDNLNFTTDALNKYITDISNVLSEISNSNLNTGIDSEYVGQFNEIKVAINKIVGKLNVVFKEFNSASEQVLIGSRQVSESSSTLAEGTIEQTDSIDMLNSTIELINDKINQSAIKANEVNELSESSKVHAATGDKAMKTMLESMDAIASSSNDISKIIKVIDEIAFQTNLLALNAAVEAARAGVHGKGFAVVAEEVRNLAARSQNAARETTVLIETSISKVNEGTTLATATDAALKEIVSSINEMSDIIEVIAGLSSEQANAIDQVSIGITQVAKVVQSNSASAEEGAASSEELSSQSEMLQSMISAFELKA